MIIVLSVESIIYPPPLTRIRKEKLNQNNNMEQEIKDSIFRCFIEQQCFEPWSDDIPQIYHMNDESYLMTYKNLQQTTKIDKKILKPFVLGMRNDGLIELRSGIDINGDIVGYLGTGYMLTEKGLRFINENYPYKNLSTPSEKGK